MKKKLLIVAALVIVLSILAAGTVAYFTSRVTTHSVITTGGVSIELRETMLDGNGKEVPFRNPDTLVPGQSFSKIVTVKNLEAEAFVRVEVALQVKKTDGTTETTPLVIDYDTDNWKLDNGWYYYKKALAKDQVTEPLFENVSLTGAQMDNSWQGAEVKIVVRADAVQTANNGTDPVKASGWSK